METPWSSDYRPIDVRAAHILGGRRVARPDGAEQYSISWDGALAEAIGFREVLERYVGRKRVDAGEYQRLTDLRVTADARGLQVGSLNMEVPTIAGSLDDIAKALLALAERRMNPNE